MTNQPGTTAGPRYMVLATLENGNTVVDGPYLSQNAAEALRDDLLVNGWRGADGQKQKVVKADVHGHHAVLFIDGQEPIDVTTEMPLTPVAVTLTEMDTSDV